MSRRIARVTEDSSCHGTWRIFLSVKDISLEVTIITRRNWNGATLQGDDNQFSYLIFQEQTERIKARIF